MSSRLTQKNQVAGRAVDASSVSASAETSKELSQVPLQSHGIPRFAFPDDAYAPSELGERPLNLAIPVDIAVEFGAPELYAALRRVGKVAARVPVPKAAVDKEREPAPGKHDVRRARKVSAVKSKTDAQAVKDAADRDFRGSVLLAYSRHQGAPLGRNRRILLGFRLALSAHRY